jgi:hypothetical protein
MSGMKKALLCAAAAAVGFTAAYIGMLAWFAFRAGGL